MVIELFMKTPYCTCVSVPLPDSIHPVRLLEEEELGGEGLMIGVGERLVWDSALGGRHGLTFYTHTIRALWSKP